MEKLRILSLNCQRGYQADLGDFLRSTLARDYYDFILLQEATEPVLSALVDSEAYRSLVIVSGETKRPLCIVYRESYKPLKSDSISFDDGNPFVGMLCGMFETERGEISVGSLHLHAGIRPRLRLSEIQEAVDFIKRFSGSAPFMFGGDCNFGVPFELGRACRAISSDARCITRGIGPTLDSRYVEPSPHLTNKVSQVLKRFGLGLRFSVDHVFVSTIGPWQSRRWICRILPDRISDHSPVEACLE